MKLKCWLMRNALADVGPNRGLPKWAQRHVAECRGCQEETAAYQLLRQMLSVPNGGDKCGLTWNGLRNKLESFPIEYATRRRAPFLALSASALLGIAVILALFLHPQKSSEPVRRIERIARSTVRDVRADLHPRMQIPANREQKIVSGDVSEQHISSNKTKTKTYVRRITPERLGGLPIRRHSRPERKSNQPNAAPLPASPELEEQPSLPVISLEEHAIRIAGIDSESAPKDEHTSYAIRLVGNDDESSMPF